MLSYVVQTDYMSGDEQIQANCKRFREEAGLTQQQVAEAIGQAIDTVRSWEQKKRTPERDSLARLAKLYGRTMEHFFMTEPPAAAAQKPDYAVSFKVSGNAPPGMREDAEAMKEQLLRKYNPEYAHKQARAKKQLHRR
jgi:transcriptional regulator with XRE-family HTH domain